jgi:hypothetical protein
MDWGNTVYGKMKREREAAIAAGDVHRIEVADVPPDPRPITSVKVVDR